MLKKNCTASSFRHKRETYLASVCLLVLSACVPSQCPEGDCASTPGSDSIQTAEHTSAPAQGVGAEAPTGAAMVSQQLENSSVDNANKQVDMGGKPVDEATGSADDQNETVGQISYDDTVIKASVISTGCTLAEHFQVEHAVQGSTCRVTLVRTKPDYCRRAPFMMDVAIEWMLPAECESLLVEFTNPIVDLVKATSKSSTARQLPKE